MALTIDELNIQIAADSQKATRALTSLIKKLEKLKLTLQGTSISNITISNSFNKVTNTTNKATAATQKYENATKRSNKSNRSFTDNLANQISKWRTLTGAFRSAANMMANWFQESNDYIETLNLFNVTMGEGSEAAKEYAESVSDLMGIDPAEWMQNQGVFKNLVSGFGVAEDASNTMSQNLTQLSYDMASFFNTDVETAFDKLSSAMSGQVKGLREFGIDTTVASLQEYALSKGIDASVRSMTQAEKSMLRYNYIMEKSILMQGDMARTLVTPANALRVLSSQFTQLKRALGNIISVIVTGFIPYVQAMVSVLTDAAHYLARLFGFELPEIDYSGLDSTGFAEDMEDTESAVGGTSDTLKKIKKQLMGFDELNILSSPDADSGAGAGSGAGGGSLNGMKPLEYNFLENLSTSKLDEIKEKMKGILEVAGLITAGILAWSAYSFWKELDGIQKKMLGITLMVTGFALEFDGAVEIGNGTASLVDYLKTILGAGLGIAGSLIVFGTGPLGWTIGITAAVSVFLAGFTVGYNQKQLREDLEKRFGEIALTVSEITEYAGNLTTTDLALKINWYVEEKEAVDQLKKQLESSLVTLSSLNFRMKLGLDVEEDSYQTAIDKYIQDATDYLTQKQVLASVSIEILLGGTSAGDGLTAFATSFYSESQAKLSELGKKLKDTVASGFVDGVWIDDKLQEAVKLQKEIQEIVDYVSDVEYQAKIKAIQLDASKLDMDATSFQSILEQAQSTISEKMESLKGIRLESLKIAQMEYDQNILKGMSKDAAKQIYDTAAKAAQKAFEDGKLELNYGTVNFGVKVLQDKYAEELSKASSVFSMTTRSAFETGFLNGVRSPEEIYAKPVQDIIYGLQNAYELSMRNLDISSAASENLEELVKQLQPSKEQYQEIADAARLAGETVPEEVRKGLSDIAKLEAITGSLQAQSYLIGEQLSTDPSFLDLLATAKNAGEEINGETARGLLANVQVVEDASKGTITLINDTIGERVYEVTPELVKNMSDLGVKLSDGLLAGAGLEQEKNKQRWYEWAIWPWNWFKKKNEINSPSKLFERGGENLVQGLWNGMTSIWTKLKSWWSGLSLPSLSIKMPHFSWTTTPASGWMADVLSAIGLPTSLPKLSVSWYAGGGYPNLGELFIAREAGPELVGQIGRKTAVANNDQIVSGIEAGVYRAMMAANYGNRGGTQTIRIINEIDGDVVGEKVIEYHNGKVMQTGASPLLI